MWVASCACCNPAISAVMPPGSSSAPWRSSWPWVSWEVFPDEPPHPGPHPAAGRVPQRPLPAALVFGAAQPLLGARQFARHFRRLARPACLVRPRRRGRAVPARRALDLYPQHSLRHLREWRQPVAPPPLPPPLHLPDPALRTDLVEFHQGPLQGVLRLPAALGIRPGGRLPGAGPLPLLRLLGSLPRAHVLPDRHLGP